MFAHVLDGALRALADLARRRLHAASGVLEDLRVAVEQDWAIRPALQRRFVAEADAAFPDNPSTVVTLDSSHSPFLSMPERVVDIVTKLG